MVPFVGATRSQYLPALHRPGRWEVPVDRDLPTWTPLVIDRLKALSAPPPDEALRKRLTDVFSEGHTDAKNRILQTLKDWDRIAKKAGTAPRP